MFKRGISLFLCCLMIFSLLSNVVVSVYASNNSGQPGQSGQSAQSTAVSFIDFYRSSGMEMTMDSMTTQDYYVMGVYMSNWFKPGETTLEDLLMTNADSDFYTEFAGYMQKTSDPYLKPVIQALGQDFANNINSGDCTLVLKDGKAATGADFLYAMMSTVDADEWGIIKKVWLKGEEVSGNSDDTSVKDWGLKSENSKLYYGNSGNVTFDFAVPAYKAAIQVLYAFNPDLFASDKGIASLERLYVDAIGNIWGTPSITNSAYNGNNSTTINTVSEYDKVYLILPACMNPSTFQNGVKSSELEKAKFPLINRFALAAVTAEDKLYPKDSTSTFSEKMIPIYNLLSSTNQSKKVLNIIAVNSLSGYLFQTGNIKSADFGDWAEDNRRETLGNFIYNPDSMALNTESTTNSGLASFASNSGLVVSVNPYTLSNWKIKDAKDKDGNLSVDALAGIRSVIPIWGAGVSDTVFPFVTLSIKGNHGENMGTLNDDSKTAIQKLFALYMYTPVFLNFNNVSMTLYDFDASQSQQHKDNALLAFAEYINDETGYKISNSSGTVEIGNTGLAGKDVAALGLKGLSLFVNDMTFTIPDTGDGKYIYFSGQSNSSSTKSKLWNELETKVSTSLAGVNRYDKFCKIVGLDGATLEISGVDTLDSLFLHTGLDTTNKSGSYTALASKLTGLLGYSKITDYNQINNLDVIPIDINSSGNTATFYPYPQGWVNLGSNNNDISLSATLGLEDDRLRMKVGSLGGQITDFTKEWYDLNGNVATTGFNFYSPKEMADYILALYGYRILFPSPYFAEFPNTATLTFNKLFGKDINKTSELSYVTLSEYLEGMYLGYMVDTSGISAKPINQGNDYNVSVGSFNSAGLLPSYDISAKGGSAAARSSNSGAGVTKSEDLSFEEKQKDLINRIYGLTNDTNNDYRNNLIKNIIEGFFLTVHRTITGTWGAQVGTISTGSTSSYDSLAGFIYTPTLEELSFTATLMNNYIKIYIFCMMLLMFLLILMVLLHMRTWQQGLLTLMFMSVGLLFPYVLISNTINIGNRISNNIYSDRFDFWAMSEHLQSEISLQGYDYMSETDQWLVSANVTSDDTYTGQPGVKVRWMSPKKVDMFNNLYSDNNLSDAFVTNTQIFQWLFSSFIYDSEFEDANVNASYVYRPYNTLAIEAKSYYAWGETLTKSAKYSNTTTVELSDGRSPRDTSITTKEALAKANNVMTVNSKGGLSTIGLLSGVGRLEQNVYQLSTLNILNYSMDRIVDINNVGQLNLKGNDSEADEIGTWGLYSNDINTVLTEYDISNITNPGIYSNLPADSAQTDAFTENEPEEIGTAIYLKNTESPFYYFYSVLKMRYHDSGKDEFKNALLNGDIFKVSYDVSKDLITTDKSLTGAYRDFLDLEGLFQYVIPYLKAGNDYVADWQSVNGTEIEGYAFEYELNDDGSLDENKIGKKTEENGVITYETTSSAYKEAVKRKNAMNRIWNMYCPWVDALYDMDDIYSQNVSVGGKKLVINDTLDPSSYIVEGRPMIFSEADMEVKGYSYKDLTDVERRLQAVTEKTYKDLMYLVNYYDMDNEVLLVAAAMYATFNFNTEFSQDKFLDDSVVMYPQGFELRNFNYDAYMRLALLNSTGETVFATDDLYTRILAKTSLFTGILLLLCDVLACIAIPMIKFIILVGLLFLGILVCIACVVNPPDKIFEAISKSVVLPTFLFLVLNVAFAYVMSFIVGEGLTTYVGSKGINFATNDPTITLLVMSLLSMAYLVCAWKVLKFLIDAYKKFGMSTAIAAVGIVGAAVAHGAAGMAEKATGATVGALTAEKGNRLAGAFEGAHAGAGGVIDRRIRDKRYQKMYGGRNAGALAAGIGDGGSPSSTASMEAINKKASKAKGEGTENSGGVATEADRRYTNDLNKNDTVLGKALSTGVYAKSRVQDAIAAGKHKKELKQEVKRAKQLDRQEKGTIKERGARYLDKSLEQARQHSEYHNLKREVRASERSDELKFARWSNGKREEAVAAKKSRKVDTQY